jgi:TonB-linked SusC/RagA family outer membrane protein
MLLGIFSVSAEGYAQRQTISMNIQNGNIYEIVSEIEKQTEFMFFYKSSDIDNDFRVTVQAKNQTVSEILNDVTKGTDLAYSVNNKVILLAKKIDLIAQQIRITGTVLDEKGEPLTGANVVEKGTTNGIITDINGHFSLDISKDAILYISYIGYMGQEVAIKNQTNILITLKEDLQKLEEVIVIGYGVIRKSDLTGSVSRIGTDGLNNLPVSSIDKAIQGRVAGVHISSTGGSPGAKTSIRIRGGNSISANNEPLYVIDGFIGGDLNSLNSADIESIEILKDATATSIYGSRGANGVIMITTKKGKEGPNKIGVNFYQGFQSLSKKLPYMNGYDRAEYANAYAQFTNAPIPFPDMEKVRDTDWQDEIVRVAPITNTDISISGGTKDFQHFISANYYNQEGVYKNSGFTRYQMRINLDKKLFSWLKVGINTNVSSLHTNNSKIDFSDGMRLALTCIPIYDEVGKYVYKNPIDGQLFNNPVAMIDLLQTDTYSKRFFSNFHAEINPIKNLVIRTTIGSDYLSEKTERYEPGALPTRTEQQKGGLARLDYQDYFSILNENTVNYAFDINDKQHITLLGGFTVQKEQTSSSYTKVEGFSNDIMKFNKLSAGDPSTVTYDSNATENQMLSFLGRVNYTLFDRYLLTLVARYDGSSRLAANHKWAFFPSAALAWRLGEESFIKDMGIFHNLKLRTSYGFIGNQAINTYQSLASLNVVTPTLGGNKQTGYLLGNIENPNLKWEITSQFDIGIEASFLNGKLSFEFDYYNKETKDLLMNVEIPWTSGYQTQLQNIGKIRNQGVELMINANIINHRNFNWDLNFNISRNRNRVLDIAGADYIDIQNGVRLYKGKPAGVFVGAVYEGTWKSQTEIDDNPTYMLGVRPGTAKFKDINENGKYDGIGDYAILGNAEADFFGGFGSDFRYKNFNLEIFFQGSYGNDILNPYGNYFFFGDFSSNLLKFDEKPWSENNSTSNVVAPGAFPYNINVNSMNYSPAVQDGSYLKLKSLKFGYTLPVENIPRINKCNIYILVNNLYTWTNYQWGYDPDITGTHAVARGVDGMAYPQNRSVQAGFNVEF